MRFVRVALKSSVLGGLSLLLLALPDPAGAGGTALPPSISKAFLPSTILPHETCLITFTITNTNSVALNGVGFSDTLPVGLTVSNFVTVACGGGTLSTTLSRVITLAGGTINANSQCQFSLTVTGTAAGQYTNITAPVTSTNGGTGNTASANLDVVTPTPTDTPSNTPTVTPTVSPSNTPSVTPTVTSTGTPVPQGGTCAMPSQCGTGFCVNGVCCDTACTDPLMRCNLAGQVGTCASDAAAAPTLTPWGLIVAAILLTGVAAFALRYRVRGR